MKPLDDLPIWEESGGLRALSPVKIAAEFERLRQYEPLKGGVPMREVLLQRENERLTKALREAYEVWAGSDGFIPQTAAEGYQQRLIVQMRDAAARGLGITAEPQSGK